MVETKIYRFTIEATVGGTAVSQPMHLKAFSMADADDCYLFNTHMDEDGNPVPNEGRFVPKSLVPGGVEEITPRRLMIKAAGKKGSTTPGPGVHVMRDQSKSAIEAHPERATYVTVRATANNPNKFEFKKWTGDVPDNQREEPVIFLVMNKHRKIMAHFKKK